VIKTVRKFDEIYDSVWWPDHLMGWIPDGLWKPELIEVSKFQKSPHTFLETFTIMAAAASNTSNILLGSSVTEPFRRHPAEIAQAFLTLDHISKGRAILGIGAGEGENIIPLRPGVEIARQKTQREHRGDEASLVRQQNRLQRKDLETQRCNRLTSARERGQVPSHMGGRPLREDS